MTCPATRRPAAQEWTTERTAGRQKTGANGAQRLLPGVGYYSDSPYAYPDKFSVLGSRFSAKQQQHARLVSALTRAGWQARLRILLLGTAVTIYSERRASTAMRLPRPVPSMGCACPWNQPLLLQPKSPAVHRPRASAKAAARWSLGDSRGHRMPGRAPASYGIQ